MARALTAALDEVLAPAIGCVDNFQRLSRPGLDARRFSRLAGRLGWAAARRELADRATPGDRGARRAAVSQPRTVNGLADACKPSLRAK